MKKLFIFLMCIYFVKVNATSYSMNFDGSSNYVDINTSVGNGIRSIEFWFKPTTTINSSTGLTGSSFILRDDATQNHEYGIYIKGTDWSPTNVGKLAFFVRYSGTLHEIVSNSNSWIAGTWYHVAGVIDGSSGMKLYINGTLQTNTDGTATSATDTDNSTHSRLGEWGAGGIRYFNGKMDEVRLWSRAITQTEIQTKMCENLTPANETGLQGYYKVDEGSGTVATDATSNGYNGTVSGATWSTDIACTFSPANYVLNYNGTSNYVSDGTSVGNGLQSIEFWFKPAVTIDSSTSISGYSLIVRNDGTQSHEYGVYIKGADWSGVGNVGHLAFFVRHSGTLHEIISNASSWTSGTWYHVAGVIDASAGMKLYINGVLQANLDGTGTAVVDTDNSDSTYFGVWGNTHTRYFNGRMDELRLWTRAISATDIQTKMCKTLVTANETGLKAYYRFNEGSGTSVLDAIGSYNGIVHLATWITDTYCSSVLYNKTSGIIPVSNPESLSLNVYPNPTSGYLSIELINSTSSSPALVHIYNTIGQEVKNFTIKNNISRIDVQDLDAGFYNVIVIQDDRKMISKITIQK